MVVVHLGIPIVEDQMRQLDPHVVLDVDHCVLECKAIHLEKVRTVSMTPPRVLVSRMDLALLALFFSMPFHRTEGHVGLITC